MSPFSHILKPLLSGLFLVGSLFLSLTTNAQQTQDSTFHHYDSLAKIKLQALDSSNSKPDRLNNKIDSVQQRLNSILNPNLNQLFSKRKHKKLEVSDTIRATHELDSMKRGVNHKIDSLKSINLPTDKYTRKLDSLNNISPAKYIQSVNSKIQSAESGLNSSVTNVENKVNKPVTNIESKVNDKLNVMKQEGGTNANLPGNLDAKGLSIDNPNLPNANGLPGTNIKSGINGVDNPLGKIENPIGGQNNPMSELTSKAGDLKNIPQQELGKINSIDEIGNAKEKLGDVNKATDQIQSLKTDAKDLPNTLEKKAGNLNEIKDLQKQTGEITKMQGQLDQVKAGANNPDAMKDLAKQQIQKQAIDHFRGKEQVLQQAMDKINKLKAKYPEIKSLADLPKHPHSLKGKPFIERIIPGLTLQFQKIHNYSIDINPVVSYRIDDRFNAGAGWNERLSFTKWNKLSPGERIYGPRVFGSYSFKKGYAVKAEVEKMNVLIPSTPFATDGSRQWIWSVFVGLKKDYNFIGKVRGNVQILYNLYDDHYNSPYSDRFSVRMGFEFPMKKVKKPVK